MLDGARRRERPEENCGVFGIFSRDHEVARTTFFGLYALQHRGQESAGIATADGEQIVCHARMGLVSQVFNEEDLSGLTGHIAIGHTRYSTMGASRACNAQPLMVDGPAGQIALAHNGNLVNANALRAELERSGFPFDTTTDSEVIAAMIVSAPGDSWSDRVAHVMPRLVGAYSLTIATRDELIAVRDPLGVRPLCVGRMGTGWLVSSESCALDTVGAQFIREIEPGEIVSFGTDGDPAGPVRVHSRIGQRGVRRATCVFEFIYFARPDSVIDGKLVYQVRQEMGRRLAREKPAEADIVIAVPDSATPAAIGYAEESGIPYREGLVKSRYIHRTFIQPEQGMRRASVDLKFNTLPEILGGKRVVVVDDSIVRGTTTGQLVRLLRKGGAREVHVRIHCPPFVNPCYLGIDVARKGELIAAKMTVDQVCEHIGADSLGFLSVGGLLDALGLPEKDYCRACFTGQYPVNVQLELDKLALES
ncbi:MAG: amidophosphoribosyltransferase [Chloroflexota bacterium]|nr:MAG: amidophosphoribosyltransferase [Chloroflexota bacterium]